MKYLLLFLGKIIFNLFKRKRQHYDYFTSWWYLYNVSLQGLGRMQGNPIEESGELDVIKKILKESGETVTIIDVGANKGQYSSHIMANVPSNKKLQLHIFEPSAPNIPLLKEQFNTVKYPAHTFYINQSALSDTDATAFLYADEKGSDLSSLLDLKVPIRPFDESEKEEVKVIRLDTYLDAYRDQTIDLLKIDVEGTEYKVLMGAMQAINRNKIKHIQFEFGAGNITSRIFFNDFWNLLSPRYNFSQVLFGGQFPINAYSIDYEIFKTTNYFLTLKS